MGSLTLVAAAERVGSGQADFARTEAADPAVSIDRITLALLVLGVTAADMARLLRLAARR